MNFDEIKDAYKTGNSLPIDAFTDEISSFESIVHKLVSLFQDYDSIDFKIILFLLIHWIRKHIDNNESLYAFSQINNILLPILLKVPNDNKELMMSIFLIQEKKDNENCMQIFRFFLNILEQSQDLGEILSSLQFLKSYFYDYYSKIQVDDIFSDIFRKIILLLKSTSLDNIIIEFLTFFLDWISDVKYSNEIKTFFFNDRVISDVDIMKDLHTYCICLLELDINNDTIKLYQSVYSFFRFSCSISLDNNKYKYSQSFIHDIFPLLSKKILMHISQLSYNRSQSVDFLIEKIFWILYTIYSNKVSIELPSDFLQTLIRCSTIVDYQIANYFQNPMEYISFELDDNEMNSIRAFYSSIIPGLKIDVSQVPIFDDDLMILEAKLHMYMSACKRNEKFSESFTILIIDILDKYLDYCSNFDFMAYGCLKESDYNITEVAPLILVPTALKFLKYCNTQVIILKKYGYISLLLPNPVINYFAVQLFLQSVEMSEDFSNFFEGIDIAQFTHKLLDFCEGVCKNEEGSKLLCLLFEKSTEIASYGVELLPQYLHSIYDMIYQVEQEEQLQEEIMEKIYYITSIIPGLKLSDFSLLEIIFSQSPDIFIQGEYFGMEYLLVINEALLKYDSLPEIAMNYIIPLIDIVLNYEKSIDDGVLRIAAIQTYILAILTRMINIYNNVDVINMVISFCNHINANIVSNIYLSINSMILLSVIIGYTRNIDLLSNTLNRALVRNNDKFTDLFLSIPYILSSILDTNPQEIQIINQEVIEIFLNNSNLEFIGDIGAVCRDLRGWVYSLIILINHGVDFNMKTFALIAETYLIKEKDELIYDGQIDADEEDNFNEEEDFENGILPIEVLDKRFKLPFEQKNIPQLVIKFLISRGVNLDVFKYFKT